MTICERLKVLRKELNMTQSEFGEKIGVKGNTITNYESGNRSMSDQTILSICREFNVNRLWLEGKEDIDDNHIFLPKPEGVLDELKTQYKLSDIEVEVLENFLELDNSQREDFIKLIKKVFT